MAFFQEPLESAMFRFAELVYTEAFRRLGLEFRYKVYPPARAGIMADSGEIDGEPGRIIAYGEGHPNLIRVDEAVWEDRVLAFATDPGIALDGWESLRDTHYRVDYFRGVAIVHQHLPELVPAGKLSTVSDAPQALKKLIAGRTDVFVDTEKRVLPLLHSPEFKDFDILVVGTMQDISSYPYLHMRHAALVPKLADVLGRIKAEGLFEQYMQQAQQEFG